MPKPAAPAPAPPAALATEATQAPTAAQGPPQAPTVAAGPQAGTWAGLPNFTCPSCPYASLDRGLVEAHLAAEHKES